MTQGGKLKKENGNLIMPDTNVLLGDTKAVTKLINSENLVVLPLTVLIELDKLKRDSRIGSEARRVIRELDALITEGNPGLVVEKNTCFEGLCLPRDVPDNQIMATFNHVVKNNHIYGAHQRYKLVTEDINMRIIAHSLFKDYENVIVESYRANTVEPKHLHDLAKVRVSVGDPNVSFNYDEEVFGEVPENGGVIIKLVSTDSGAGNGYTSLTIRKGDKLEPIPEDLELFGLKATHKKKVNYGQLLAFRQLTDPGIQCVFISGPAGTGKTLIAIAAALEQKDDFKQFLIVSPMVPLSGNGKMGYLPGDLKEKSAPWLLPFNQNLSFLETLQKQKMEATLSGPKRSKKAAKNAKLEVDTKANLSLWEKYGFICQPLDYIRGQTIPNAFIIIEEAQNLSQHEVKTIITRAGEGSKLVFCGDLSQIDLSYLSVRNSGLTYAIEKISGTGHKNKMVGVTVLTETVRSKLAAFASEVM